MKILHHTTLAVSLAAALVACPGAKATPRSAVPAPLAGGWHFGSLSPDRNYDPRTGEWKDVNGVGAVLVLEADGTYEKWGLGQTSAGACELSVFYWNTGTVELSGDRYTLHPSDSATKFESSCNPQSNRETQGTAKTASYTWRVEDGNGGPVLVETSSDGVTVRYQTR